MLSSLISMLHLAEWPRVCSALITALQRTLGMIGNDFVKMISWCIANQHRAPLEVILPDQYQQFTCKCWKHNAAGKAYQSPCRVYKLTHQNQKCGLGNLCSAMFYTLGKSESRENFWCLRPSVVSPLQETYTFLRWGKKNLFKKKLSRCQVFFTSFKMFFCWAWCDCESFLKGKLQASYVQTSKLVGCIGYHDQICSIVWFFLFKTPTKLSYPTCLWIWGMVWEMRYTYMICICIFMDHDN